MIVIIHSHIILLDSRPIIIYAFILKCPRKILTCYCVDEILFNPVVIIYILKCIQITDCYKDLLKTLSVFLSNILLKRTSRIDCIVQSYWPQCETYNQKSLDKEWPKSHARQKTSPCRFSRAMSLWSLQSILDTVFSVAHWISDRFSPNWTNTDPETIL